MKKLIYLSFLVPAAVFLLPVSCTTRNAAVKPQSAPARQEQPASESGQSTAQEAAQQTAAPDALSGATVDSVSGATLSRSKDVPAPENRRKVQQDAPVTAASKMTPAAERKTGKETRRGHTVSEKPEAAAQTAQIGTAAGSSTAAEQSAASTAKPAQSTAAASLYKIGTQQKHPDKSIAENTAPAPAEQPNTEKAISQAGAFDTEPAEPVVEQNPPDYAESLVALINDFEEQGGSHGYEQPRTFHEEMLDLFSPQIFTAALSKEPETEQKVKVSRMVAVEEKQRVELVYPGHGWVYVGEQTSQPGMKYEQRKLQDNTSIFTFTAEKKGDYVLHFSYFDVFTNDFVTDAIAVSVSAARSNAAKSTVKAPEYKNKSDAAGETQAEKTAQPENMQPVAGTKAGAAENTPAVPTAQADDAPPIASAETPGDIQTEMPSEQPALTTDEAPAVNTEKENPFTPEQLLEKANAAIGNADAVSALKYLDSFFDIATERLDEGWFLRGRAYELNGPARNIRLALTAYKMLTDGFPQSKYWAAADARIRYITGFYINIQ